MTREGSNGGNMQNTVKYSEEESIEEAKELLGPVKTHNKELNVHLFGNVASYISILAIAATIIQYRINLGYCKVYNIPTNAIEINLKNYIPCCIQLIFLSTFILLYRIEETKDRVLHINWINPIRLLYGVIVLLRIVMYNRINKVYPTWICVIISCAIPLFCELFVYFERKSRGRREQNRKEKNHNKEGFIIKVEQHLHNWLIYHWFIKSGLLFFIIITMVSPHLGRISAITQTDYQVCIKEDQEYAVIIDGNETCLVQAVLEDADQLNIYANSYQFFDKQGLVFSFRSYQTVSILDKDKEYSK